MERKGEEVDVTTTEARSGSTPHIVRYVLLISLVLTIVALTIIWVAGAARVDDGSRTGAVTNQPVPVDAAPEADEASLAGDSVETMSDAPMINDTIE